jgi:hypothetical protein
MKQLSIFLHIFSKLVMLRVAESTKDEKKYELSTS